MWPRWVALVGLACGSGSSGQPVPHLLLYTLTFTANWTQELFPKQYPLFRPAAQWSRVVGVSHNEQFRLYQLGGLASPELKLFAETGRQELLGSANSSSGSVLDQFLLPAITTGTGSVTAHFFVDNEHSKVSLIAKIVPSPDWFVGIDSLELCANGHWVDSVTQEASPVDAGTDSGLTFTAPNWETQPQEPIFQMTAQYPRHHASSFHYPKLHDLPPIATFTLVKKRSYEAQSVSQATATAEPQPWAQQDWAHHQWKTIKKRTRKKKISIMNGFNKRVNSKCVVGEWSDWSACNGPCGQSKRVRPITTPGLVCPPLLQERTCGCTKYIFNW